MDKELMCKLLENYVSNRVRLELAELDIGYTRGGEVMHNLRQSCETDLVHIVEELEKIGSN